MSDTALPQSDDYHTILLKQTPLLDVRAPVEFCRGAFANTANRPLMNDVERAAVGTCYKQQGQQAAIALGHQLVNGPAKTQRIDDWQQFAQQHPNGLLYCARGGLRSQIAQQWLFQHTGIVYPKVKGGFKALRQAAISVIEQSATAPIFLLAGATGSGKTRLLKQLNAVDLEALANHRGSAFGRHLTAQPSQIRFEHDLASAILRDQQSHNALLLEDESLLIGQRNIPHALFQAMQQSPLLVLHEPLSSRIEVILQDYVVDLYAQAQQLHPEQAFTVFAEALQSALLRIAKRLGGLRYSALQQQLTDALIVQQQDGDISLHRQWIAMLLSDYYDPMYQYQLNTRQHKISMQGSAEELAHWWRQYQRS